MACSPVKMTLVEKGGANEAIENAIADFTNLQKVNNGRNRIYNVSVKNLSNGLIGVSILDYSEGKVYLTESDSIGSNRPFFPTKYKEVNKRLFYWYDSKSFVSKDILEKLTQLHHVDSSYYHNPNNLSLSFNDSQKAMHYYFCPNDLTRYSRVESNIALGYGKIPKLNCK